MKISGLTKFDFSEKTISCLINSGINYLLPLQVQAINSFGLLESENLLINGPTSSGKSFCGELAAISCVERNKKSVIVVPFKALAREKYKSISKCFRQSRIRSLIVTSDYRENKAKFRNGKYDIAVITYEMLNNLLAEKPSLLESIGTVVMDEFQLIAERDRGLQLESLLAKLNYQRDNIQKIGLVGGIDDCRLLSDWLCWPVLNFTNRPVDLYRGTLLDGIYSYQSYNNCRESLEYFQYENLTDFENAEYGAEINSYIQSLLYFLKRGEQVLVFVRSRDDSRKFALVLSELIEAAYSPEDNFSLDILPDTNQKIELIKCLKKGVAFHNADLCQTSRTLIESGFKSGWLKTVFATSTLMYGVNLPSKNVFVTDFMYHGDGSGRAAIRPTRADEFNQACGRAGRWGHIDDFGRAIVVVKDREHNNRIWKNYLNKAAKIEVQPLLKEDYAILILDLINQGLIRDEEDIIKYLKKTLRSYTDKSEIPIPRVIVEMLSKFNFVKIKGCGLACRDLGKVVCKHNIDIDTAAQIAKKFLDDKIEDRVLSWMFELALIEKENHLANWLEFNQSQVIEIVNRVISKLNDLDETPAGKLKEFIEKQESSCNSINYYYFLCSLIF